MRREAEEGLCSIIFNQLTLRERDILCWLSNGKTDREIATSLGLSERTVQHHVQSVFAKLDTKKQNPCRSKSFAYGADRAKSYSARKFPLGNFADVRTKCPH